jgi:hypothetical protein
MLLRRPRRIVRVTTEKELDSKLQSADQVIVEGNDRLLSYAIAEASKYPQTEFSVNVAPDAGGGINTGINTESVRAEVFAVGRDATAVRTDRPERSSSSEPQQESGELRHYDEEAHRYNVEAEERARLSVAERAAIGDQVRRAAAEEVAKREQHKEKKGILEASFDESSDVPWPEASPQPAALPSRGVTGLVSAALFLLLALAVGAGLAIYLSARRENALPVGSASPTPTSTVSPSNIPSILQTLAWPAVTIIAIIFLCFIATRAIAGGRNVEISWKVTEKVTGRIVITKVRTRATTRRAAVG